MKAADNMSQFKKKGKIHKIIQNFKAIGLAQKWAKQEILTSASKIQLHIEGIYPNAPILKDFKDCADFPEVQYKSPFVYVVRIFLWIM